MVNQNKTLIGHQKSIWITNRPAKIDLGGPVNEEYDPECARRFETIGGAQSIEMMAQKFPDKLAVDDGFTQLTYSQFIDRVYGLARHIVDVTAADDIVSSLVANVAAAPIIVMACALTGRVLVPIDASHPLERQAAIFAESGARAVLLAQGAAVDESFIPASIPRIVVDPLVETGADRPQSDYDPRRPLFVSFTSGSTGRPKGIVAGGRYGGAAIRSFIDMFHLNPRDVVLGLASLSTGGSRDVFATLGAGAAIRILDVRAVGLMEALRVMDAEEVSILSFVPSALRMVLGMEGAERCFRHLRVLDLHGERILASDIALFREKLPPSCHISVTMGSVEAGAVFSWFVRDEQISGPVVPVGYLMPGRSVALLDEAGAPVAAGEVGELMVRGPMALGAWRGGAMVRGPFLPDPEDPGSSIYPMGDLMRQRPDGLFEYVGRKDRRLKIHGLWADLGEVETAVQAMDDVAEAVVVAAGQAGAEHLAAFIVLEKGAKAPTAGAVRRAVALQTADHMAPAEIHVLAEMPRLANFKPDMVRLKNLSAASVSAGVDV